MSDGSIIIDTKVDTKKLPQELKKLYGALKKGLGVALKGAAVAAGLLAAAFVAVTKGAQEFSKATDRVDKLSQKIGISRKAFQEWDFILSQSGARVEGLQMSVKTLARAADEAQQGTESYAESFERLGISITDTNGKMKDQEVLFNETFSALSDLESETERTALASELLGRSATELAPAFNQGSEAIEKMRKEAHELGLVMSDDMIDSGVILTDNLDKLKRVGKGLFLEIFSGVVPALNNATNALTEWITGQGGVQGIIMKIGDFFRGMINGVKKAWILFVGGNKYLFEQMASAFELTMVNLRLAGIAAVNGLKIAFLTLAQVISDYVLGSVSNLLEVMGKLPFVGEMFQEAADSTRGFSNELSAVIEASKNASAQAIRAAQTEKQRVIAAGLDRLRAIEEETQRKIELIDQEAAAASEARKAELAAQRAAMLAEARENQRRRQTLESQQKLITLQQEYQAAVALANQQLEDGYISQEEAQEEAQAAARRYADALYSIGVTAESAADEGGDALRKMIDVLNSGSAKVEAEDTGEDAGENIISGLVKGLKENSAQVIKAAKGIIIGIGQAIQSGISFFGRAISWAAAFDPVSLAESMKDLAKNIKEFFEKDIYQIANLITLGSNLIMDIADGINSERDSILEAIENIIITLATEIKNNFEPVLKTVIELVGGMAGVIIDNIDVILDAAFAVVEAIANGVIDNADSILNGLITAILKVVKWVTANLPAIVKLAVELAVSLVSALIKNMGIIVKGIVEMIPDILVAVVKSLPSLVYAFTYLATSILLMLATQIITMPLVLIEAFLSLIEAVVTGIRTGDFSGFMAIGGDMVAGIWNGIADAFGDVFGMIGDLFTRIIDLVKSIFGIASPSKVFEDIGKNIIQGLINGLLGMFGFLEDAVKFIVDFVVNAFNGAVDIVGDIAGGVGGFFGGVGGAIGGFFGFANGTMNAPGGLSIVGERGPELVNLPKGSQVYTAGQTSEMLSRAASATAPIIMPAGGGMNIIKINETLEIDGQAIGRVSYEYLDRMAGVS